jgi:hypothetical protein
VLSTPFYNDTGLSNTVTNAYGLVVRPCTVNGAATVTNVYGLYLNAQAVGTNRYGVYQLGATTLNYFAGKVGIGTTPTTLFDVAESPTTTAVTNITSQILVSPSQADATGTDYIALRIQQNTVTASDFSASSAGYGIVGMLCQAGAGAAGTGTTSLVNGAWIRCFKNGTGVVAEMNAIRCQVQNNVANAVTLSRALLVMSPQAVTGTFVTHYGVYIDDQMPAGVTTGYGVYQVGATTLNYFAGPTTLAASLTTALIVQTAAALSLTSAHNAVMANTTSNSIVVTLPTAVGITGRQYTVKKTAAVNTLTVATTSAETIDGQASLTITDHYVSVTVISDGTNWNII